MLKTKTITKNKILLPIISFILIIGTWELLDCVLNINNLILPSPRQIFLAIINNIPLLLQETGITTLEAIIGFVIGFLFAYFFASLFVFSASTKNALYPYAIALKATPIFALGPILVVWFGTGIFSKIIMSALVCFFPILVNLVKGFTSIDSNTLDLFKTLEASRLQIFKKLRIPSSNSYLFPALKIASTMAIIGATIAEFIGASHGIGYLIVNSSYYLNIDLMFASIIMISIVGILLFYLIEYIERKIVFWEIN